MTPTEMLFCIKEATTLLEAQAIAERYVADLNEAAKLRKRAQRARQTSHCDIHGDAPRAHVVHTHLPEEDKNSSALGED
jgi:hypothetical protein